MDSTTISGSASKSRSLESIDVFKQTVKHRSMGGSIYIYMYMPECMYVCVYVSMYVRTYIRMYVCTYASMHICRPLWTDG